MNEMPILSFVKHDEINQVLWNENILKSINGNVYANFWYLDVVTNNKWDAIISADYKWLMPLPSKKKFGFKYLPTPVFVQQLGIYGPGPFTEEICNHFLKHLESNYDLIEFQINHANSVKNIKNYKLIERKNLILEIDSKKEKVKSDYSDGIKRKINKALKANLKVNTASIRSLIKLFQDYNESNLKDWNFDNYSTLEELYHMSSLRNIGICLGAYDQDGILLSGAFILEYKSTATLIFSGNSEVGKEKGALTFLISNYIENAPQHISYFDFEGSDDEGLYQFYSGFGAKEFNYLHLKKNNLPFYVRIFKK
jgi:hypothetical protein